MYAPYWSATMLILLIIGLGTNYFNWDGFLQGYVLDMTGPAWSYILFRGLFTGKTDNKWTRFFTAKTTLFVFILILVSIETIQYFKLYDGTYDPWDFLAYSSILLPFYFIDSYIARNYESKESNV